MRIAVTYENGTVFQHFGHCGQFKLYDVEDGQVIREQIAEAGGSGHGALAGLLSGLEVDTLICGGIGGGAQDALAQAGIRVYGGVTGGTDDAVRAFLAGGLAYNPEVRCSHHDHDSHDRCGEDHHGCAGNCGDKRG